MRTNTHGTYDFMGTVKAITAKAVLVQFAEKEVWLPKSLCTFPCSHIAIGQETEVLVPMWFAEQHEFEDEAE